MDVVLDISRIVQADKPGLEERRAVGVRGGVAMRPAVGMKWNKDG
jgi:hypothetical protein